MIQLPLQNVSQNTNDFLNIGPHFAQKTVHIFHQLLDLWKRFSNYSECIRQLLLLNQMRNVLPLLTLHHERNLLRRTKYGDSCQSPYICTLMPVGLGGFRWHVSYGLWQSLRGHKRSLRQSRELIKFVITISCS